MQQALSDSDLVKIVETIAAKEHQVTVKLLLYLGELDRRKAYLGFGYTSLFAFCTQRLRYSEPAAYRRICSARAIRDFPEARTLLEAREISFTTLSLVQTELDSSNSSEILNKIKGQSKESVQRIIALYKSPALPKRESIRAITTQPAIETASRLEEQRNLPRAVPLMKIPFPSRSEALPTSTFSRESKSPEPAAIKPQLKYKVSLEIDEALMKKITRLKEIRPYKALSELLELVVDDYLKRNAPENKRQSDKPSRARIAPGGLRALVLAQDNYQCTFVGQDGTRCNCKADLEIDHIDPAYLGGTTERSNLRTLCAAHNRFEARQMMLVKELVPLYGTFSGEGELSQRFQTL